MTDPHWRENPDRHCAGLPIATIDTDTYGKSGRDDAARRICEGCPVITDCRTAALENWSHESGVILAGVAIPSGNDKNERRRAYRALQCGRFLASPRPRLKARTQEPTKDPASPKRRPKTCTGCGWKLAPRSYSGETCPPDHRIHYAHGICRICRTEAAGGTPGPKMKHRTCIDCGAVMQSHRKARDKESSVRAHRGGGRCEPCYYLHRKAAKGAA